MFSIFKSNKELRTEPKKKIETEIVNNSGYFSMIVEDIFAITGRGIVVTGTVQSGVININDEVDIITLNGNKRTVVTGVEMFRKNISSATTGDNVGLLLRGVTRDEITRGDTITK